MSAAPPPDEELAAEIAGLLSGALETDTRSRTFAGLTCPECGGRLTAQEAWRSADLLREAAPAAPGPLSRGEALTAQARAARARARPSAAQASDVMGRLAVTYAQLALSSRYRVPRMSTERGQLLALSGRARDLARQYQRHAAGDAG